MRALLEVILLALQLYIYLIVASAILSWLVAFNVVNTRNDFVRSIWNFLDAVTEPALRPIRNILPNLGGVDISPIILILLIIFIQNADHRSTCCRSPSRGRRIRPWRLRPDGLEVRVRVTPRGGRDAIDGLDDPRGRAAAS